MSAASDSLILPGRRAWPSGPVPINRCDPLGDCVVAVLPLSGGRWLDLASGQHAVPSNSWTLDLGGATGGTFTLTFNGQTTSAITFSPTLSQVKTPLSALTNLVGVVGVTGSASPFTIGMNGKTGTNGTLTGNFGSLTGGTGASVTLAAQPLPQPTAPDGTWPWAPGLAMDTFPAGVTTCTMKLPLLHKLFTTDPSTTLLPGWSNMWIIQPDNIPSQLSYNGDCDQSDFMNLYWNTTGKLTSAILNAAGTGLQTPFPTTGFASAPQWLMVVKSVSQGSAFIWANFDATTGAQKPYMVQQNSVSTADLHKTWNSGGNWLHINGQGPQSSDTNRFHGKTAAQVIWPRPIGIADANRLLRDPWCFLAGRGG